MTMPEGPKPGKKKTRQVNEAEQLVGTLAVRVKWLPQGCHIREAGHQLDVFYTNPSPHQELQDEGKRVVRTVPYAEVNASLGLEPVAYLEQFAVAEEFRGTGLSLRMLRYAEDLARAWGLKILTLHVQRDDWQPLRFYQKNGFEITSDWMGRGPQRFLLIKPL